MRKLILISCLFVYSHLCMGQTVVTNTSQLAAIGIVLTNVQQTSPTEYAADFSCYYKKRSKKCRGSGGMCMKGRISYEDDGDLISVSGEDGEGTLIGDADIRFETIMGETEVSLDPK